MSATLLPASLSHLNRQSVQLPGTCQPGQTGIYRRTGFENQLALFPPQAPHVRNLHDVFVNGVRTSPNSPYLGTRPFNPTTSTYHPYYEWQTYTQVFDRVQRFGSGLLWIHQELFPNIIDDNKGESQRQWTLGIWASNRAEWTMAAAACNGYDLISVGMYDTLGPEAVRYGIVHSECSICVSGINHISTLLLDSEKMPVLKVIISMDSLSSTPTSAGSTSAGPVLRALAESKGIQLYDWAQIEALGAKYLKPFRPPTSPQSVCIHCYTSGTTGNPKAAVMTHANYISGITSLLSVLSLTSSDTVISFMPMPHIFGRVVELLLTTVGGQIGYFTGNSLNLLNDTATLQPTFFPSAPRILNRIYSTLYKVITTTPGIKGLLARHALSTKLKNLESGQGNKHSIWDKVLFSKVQQLLGGKVRLMVVGSAPIPAKVLLFLRVVFCVDILEVYGQTENVGASTYTFLDDTIAGHVGTPTVVSEIKLVDVPELNYLTTDQPFPRGELWTRGNSVFPGYLKSEKQTLETLDQDGWMHSGDIATLDPKTGRFMIIDRIKNVFKLSQGEYVALEKIENLLGTDHLSILMQWMVYGISTESFLIALVVPDPEQFLPFAKQVLMSIMPSIQELNTLNQLEPYLNHPVLIKAVLEKVKQAGAQAGLKGFEVPKNLAILKEPFSVDNDMLTPTFKVKRQTAVQVYKDLLDQLYDEANKNTKSRL